MFKTKISGIIVSGLLKLFNVYDALSLAPIEPPSIARGRSILPLVAAQRLSMQPVRAVAKSLGMSLFDVCTEGAAVGMNIKALTTG